MAVNYFKSSCNRCESVLVEGDVGEHRKCLDFPTLQYCSPGTYRFYMQTIPSRENNYLHQVYAVFQTDKHQKPIPLTYEHFVFKGGDVLVFSNHPARDEIFCPGLFVEKDNKYFRMRTKLVSFSGLTKQQHVPKFDIHAPPFTPNCVTTFTVNGNSY